MKRPWNTDRDRVVSCCVSLKSLRFENFFVVIKRGHDVKTVHVKYHFDDNNNNNIIEAAHHSMKRRARYLALLKATFCMVGIYTYDRVQIIITSRYLNKDRFFVHLSRDQSPLILISYRDFSFIIIYVW